MAQPVALAVVVLFVAAAILAPWIAPYPAQGAGAPNVVAKLQPPSAVADSIVRLIRDSYPTGFRLRVAGSARDSHEAI